MTPPGRGDRAAPALPLAALAPLAVALLAVAVAARPPPFTIRERPADAPAPPAPPPAVRALVFADFGDPGPQQQAVAAALARAARRPPAANLVFALGDNLYECGPDPGVEGASGCRFEADGATVVPGFTAPEDPLFARRFEDALRDVPDLPLYVALGNHDVGAELRCRTSLFGDGAVQRRKACLSVAHRSQRWTMPARHYVVDAGPARFVVLDTNVLTGDYGGFDVEQEAAFLRDAARTREGRLLFVLGHHPAATAGSHAGDHDPAYAARLKRLEDAAGGAITAWLAGHDHDLQHLRAAAGYDVLVSGNSSRGRADERFERVVPPGAHLRFASTEWGFLSVEVSSTHWSARFESDRGEPLHCCHASLPGRCEPVACGAPR